MLRSKFNLEYQLVELKDFENVLKLIKSTTSISYPRRETPYVNIIKNHTSTGRPANSSITSKTTLYWGPACLTGNGFQTTPRTICDNICGQSCKKQIATKTHACLNQSGMGFGCDLLAGAQLLYHASCEKSRHMSTIVSRNVVARGIATRWA